jgi:predicted DNA-binding transcriptional regulator YafY
VSASIPEAVVLREEADGSRLMRVTVPSIHAAVAYALSHGPDLVVLDPPEVRDAIVAAAQELLQRYGQAEPVLGAAG